MSLAAFTWTTRVRPLVELGFGDSRTFVGAAWDVGKWDDATARWSGLEPAWFDISCDTRNVRLEYGRKATTDRFVAGAATVVVDNASGWADPNVADAIGVLNVRPGRQVRVSVVHAVYGQRVLFRGYVDSVTPVYSPLDTDTVELSCIDALGEVNRTKLKPQPAPVGAGEWASVRVARILDAAGWLPRDIAPSAEQLIATDLGGQVADMLGQTADSAGGAVFGDLEGRVAFRPRDWQSYLPDAPVDGIIGNVDMDGTPAVPPSITSHGYLTPTVGTVTTPDPGPLPNECVFVFKVRGPTGAGTHGIANQYGADPQRSWSIHRNITTAYLITSTPTGLNANAVTRSIVAPFGVTGADETLALGVTLNSAGRQILSIRRSLDDGVTWQPPTTADTGAAVAAFDANADVRVGAFSNSSFFNGRIYWCELRTGLNPAAGTVVWRFDADDYPGTGTSYVDPRGRTWTLTTAAAITPKVVDPGTPAVPPDVCPVRWERPFARADITTRAIIGRDLATAVVVDDPAGVSRYGIEPFERTDLLTQNDPSLTMLANRVIRTRGEQTAPRVRSVTLDARTSNGALDLMSTVDVYKPSRYRCRLQYAPPRGLVFDAQYFATGVVHELTPSAWSLELNLDVAAPFAIAGGRWDAAYWDLASWTVSAGELLAEARTIRDELIGATS